MTETLDNLDLETGLSGSPFPGLRPFRRDEADVFFGREAQVDQLLAKLEDCRFLAVVGVSGCGKSSLVRAGMLSALESGFMASAGPRWHVVEMRPGSHPLANLAQSIAHCDLLGDQWKERSDADAFIHAVLKRGPLGLVELLRESLSPERNNLLLLVDQFEEIFRFHRHGDANEAVAFVDLLLASARQSETPIYVVLTMRSDFLGDCSIFTGLPEAVNDGQFLIPRLTREECRGAVAGPAAAFDADVEPELVNNVLNDVGSDPDQLPLMQHALMRVWNRATAKDEDAADPAESNGFVTLTVADYEAVGGLKDALSNHADELFESLSGEDQRTAEVMFRCLSERGADGRDVRRPAPLGVIADTAHTTPEAVARVIDVFRAPTCSFLTPPAGTPLEPDTVVDISHESLIRQWRRMTGWVQTEADSAAIYRRLSETSRLWRDGRAALWTTPDLENALAWRERERPDAPWAQRYGGEFSESMAFLDAAVEARDRREREEKERQQRERELLENMARAEKQRADEAERRSREEVVVNKRLRRRAVAALAAGVVSIVLALAAILLFAQARVRQRQADQARADAVEQKDRADAARNRAVELQQVADASAESEADARRRAEDAQYRAVTNTLSAWENLGRAHVAQSRSLWTASEPGRQQQALALLKESSEFRDKSLALLPELGDDPEGWRTRTISSWKNLTPELRSQAVRWLSHTSLQQLRRLEFRTDRGRSASRQLRFALSPDGKRLAIFRPIPDTPSDGEYQIVDALSGNILATRQESNIRHWPRVMRFTADGETLVTAASQSDGPSNLSIEQRSTKDLKQTQSRGLQNYRSASTSADVAPFWFNDDATRFVYAGWFGTAVWNVGNGRIIYSDREGRAARAASVDEQLVLVEAPGRVRVVNPAAGGVVLRDFRIDVDGRSVVDAALSPDSRWLVVELRRYNANGFYDKPLIIVDAETGGIVSKLNLSTQQTYYGSSSQALSTAFHRTKPVLTAIDNEFVYQFSIPQGGILHRSRLGEGRDSNDQSRSPHEVEYSRDGGVLLTSLRPSRYYSSSNNQTPIVMMQLWDPSVASAAVQSTTLAGAVRDFHFVGNDAMVLAGGDEPDMVQLRPSTGSTRWHTSNAADLGGFDPSGKHYVRVLANNVEILDAANGRRLKRFKRRLPGGDVTLPAAAPWRWIVGVDDSGKEPKARVFDASSLEWTFEVPAPSGSDASARLIDGGRYLEVRAPSPGPDPKDQKDKTVRVRNFGLFGSVEVEGPSGRENVTSIYRTSDGSKMLETPDRFSELRVVPGGRLLTQEYIDNHDVFRARELDGGKQLGEFRISQSGYSVNLKDFQIDGEGKTAAVSRKENNDCNIWIWPFADGKPAETLPGDFDQMYSQHELLLHGGRLCANVRLKQQTPGGSRYAIQLWDVASRKLIKSHPTANDRTSFSFCKPYGTVFVSFSSSSDDVGCQVWDFETGRVEASVLLGFRGLDPSGRFALFANGKTAASDNVSEAERSNPLTGFFQKLVGGNTSIDAHLFSRTGRFVVTRERAAYGAKFAVTNLQEPDKQWTAQSSGVQFVLSPDERLMGVFEPKTALIRIWELTTGKELKSVAVRRRNFRPNTEADVSSFEFSSDGSRISLIARAQLRLANTGDPQIHTDAPRIGHRKTVHAAAVSPDEKLIAAGGDDGTVCFWHVENGWFEGLLEDGTPIRNVVFSRKGNLLATRNDKGEVVVWEWSREKNEPGSWVSASVLWSNARASGEPLDFTPDGALLAVGDDSGDVRVFDARTGEIWSWLKPRVSSPVRALDFSLKRARLAVALGSNVAIWNVETMQPATQWEAGQGPVFDLKFNDDGRTLLSAGRDARVWDVDRARLELVLDRGSLGVRRVRVDGPRVAFAVDDRTIAETDVVKLLEQIEDLGLEWSSDDVAAAAPTLSESTLWRRATDEELKAENTLALFVPRARNAEQNENWEEAVEHLGRLINLDPDNLDYRRRRSNGFGKLKQWPAAAADYAHVLAEFGVNRDRNSQRGKHLATLVREQPELYDALLKLRPDDASLVVAKGRDAIAQSEWGAAREIYSRVVSESSPNEEWFEYAALCLLTDDRKEYDRHIAWMLERETTTKEPYMAYIFARATGVSPKPPVEPQRMINWANEAIAEQPRPWYLHVAALAHYRAGELDKSRERLKESTALTWGAQYLNRLLLALIEHKSGNAETAKKLLAESAALIAEKKQSAQDGRVGTQHPDWLQWNLLLQEARTAIAAPPAGQ